LLSVIEQLQSGDFSNIIGTMFTVKYLPEFERWLNSQTDNLTRIRLSKRLDKAARGLLGDVAPVG